MVLDEWVQTLAAELRVPAHVEQQQLLEAARVAAHSVARPAAPLTTFLIGLAVAAGTSVDDAVAAVNRLAATWPAPEGDRKQ
jgi:hypothetical protein